MDSLSLVKGGVPVACLVLGFASLVLAFEYRRGVWRRQVLLAVPTAAGLVGLALLLIDGLQFVSWEFPSSFYLWGGTVFLAAAAGIAGWRAFPPWRRAVAPVPVLLTAVMVAMLINQTYQYFPSLGSLLGRNAPHEVSMQQLMQMRAVSDGRPPEHGYTVRFAIPGRVSGFDARAATMWVPPRWIADRQAALPVIELLAGVPGGPTDWTRAGQAAQTADRFARAHDGLAPLIVMPDANGSLTGDTECVDSPRGAAETYLTVDVPRAIKQAFGTATGSRSWALAGLSAGGTCAMTMTLRHPEQYVAFADYSGLAGPTVGNTVEREATIDALFGGSEQVYDAHDPLWILSHSALPQLSAWFQVGSADGGPLSAQRELVALARWSGLLVCHVELAGGGHDYDVWSQSFEDSLPWLSARLALTPEPSHSPAECARGR